MLMQTLPTGEQDMQSLVFMAARNAKQQQLQAALHGGSDWYDGHHAR